MPGPDYSPHANTPIDFRFYAPGSAQAGGDGFVSLNVLTPTAPFSDWNQYTIFENNGTWSLQEFATFGDAGVFLIYGAPVTGDDTTSWYQPAFGAQGAKTILNLYAETSNNLFTSMVTDYAVLAQNTGIQGNAPSSFSLNFANGGIPSYDVVTFNAPHTIGDINDDARADLVLQSSGSFEIAGWVMNGLTIQTSSLVPSPEPVPPVPGNGWVARATGDINNDGRTDLIFQHNVSGDLAAWELDGLSIKAANTVGPANFGTAWQVKTTGDFNGDGKADLIFQNINDAHHVVAWQLNHTIANGEATTFKTWSIGHAGAEWDLSDIGDYNGDGYSDLAFQSASGDVAIWGLKHFAIKSPSVVTSPPLPGWDVVA